MSKIKQKHPPLELLNTINNKFVQKAFQHLFIAEACKKNDKLSYRISHHLDSVFKEYCGDEQEDIIAPNTPCWKFESIWTRGTWQDFSLARSYGGLMIIPDDGSFVYAKEE